MPIFDISPFAVAAGAAVNLLLGSFWFGELFHRQLVKLHTLPTLTLDKDGIRVMFWPLSIQAALGSWMTGILALHFHPFGPDPSWWLQILTPTMIAATFALSALVTTVFSVRIAKGVLWYSGSFWGLARPMACAAVFVFWPESWP